MKRLILFLIAWMFLIGTGPAFGAEKKAAKKVPKAPALQEEKNHETSYHALIIGNNQYKYMPKLKTARHDATAVEKLLKEKFKFKTELLLDATRTDILGHINQLRKKLREKDSLIIYYAGHGEYDKTVDKAYWLPIDAQKDDPTNWIIADDITSNIKRIAAQHILIVSDSCYSGTLTRRAVTDIITTGERERYLKKMMERPSRTLMASGGDEPVSDSGDGNNSVFALAFLKAMKESAEEVFTAEEVFHGRIKPIVAGKSDQVPEYSSIRNSGDEGGDFVFALTKEGKQVAGLTVQNQEEANKLKEEQKSLAEEKAQIEAEQKRLEEQQKLEEQRRKLAEEKARLETKKKEEEERRKQAEEQKRLEAERVEQEKERKQLEAQKKEEQAQLEAEQKRLEEQQKLEEHRRKLAEERARFEAKKKKEEENRKLEEQKRLEAEKHHLLEEEKKAVVEQNEKEPTSKKIEEPVVLASAPRLSQRLEEQQKRFTNSIGMEFVLIPAGTFMMGSPVDEPGRYDDEIQHRVTISRAYYIQTTEVTQGQWKVVMENNPSRFKNCGDDCPVESISWNDAQNFIRKLNEKENTNKYRLPTEAEWEYSARAGTTTAIYNGSIKILGSNNAPALDSIAWYGGNSSANYAGGYDCSSWREKQYNSTRCGTHKAAKKQPNAWGLYDMLGNVWEWCQDWDGEYPSSHVIDPRGPSSGQNRVFRGGSWNDDARSLRAADRGRGYPGNHHFLLGFRMARDNQ